MAEDERVEETKGGEVPESKDAQRGKTESARVEGRADTLARQDLYLAHLVSGKSVSEASEAAGIDRTTGWRWRKEPEFQKRFIEARRDLFESTVAALHSSAADCIRCMRFCILSIRRCQRSAPPCFQHAIRPLPIKNPRTKRPSGQNRMKLTTVSAIQAGLPMSSSCAANACMAAPSC